VSTWGDWVRTCEQAGLTQCFQGRSSARKTRRRRSNPVAPTKIKPFSLARRVFLSMGARDEEPASKQV
jgi:hypothetical protein